MIIYNTYIPCSHFTRVAQLVPEQSLAETVSVYSDAIPYIRCMIQSTIQHEAAHRQDEETRNESILQGKQEPDQKQEVMPFGQFSNESRVEPIAESEEEDCNPLLPEQLSGEISQISLNQLFEDAKVSSRIAPTFKEDIRAGSLAPDAQGMYLMKDRSNRSVDELIRIKQSRGNVHVDGDNHLWVDVRKIAQPFIVNSDQNKIKPPTYQGPGDGAVYPDVPGVSQVPPQGINAAPGVGASPSVPSVPSRGSR